MKKIIYIFLLPIALFALASCEEWQYDYEGAEPESGAQVYFSSEAPSSYDLSSSESSFSVPVLRIDSSSSLTVSVTATQESGSIYSVPSSVTFAAGSTSTELVITYDPANLEGGVYEEITLTLNDETTMYGSSSYTFEAGLARTWYTLGTGTFYEYFWYGFETPVTIYYYVEDNIYHCKVYGTDGTSASYGGALGMGQDFEFLIYMDEFYNGYPIVEVPRQYSGYCYENGICELEDATCPIYVGDYYDLYYYRYITYSGYTLDDYPALADYITFLNYYNPQGYYYPGWFNTDTGVIETNAHWYVYYADGSLYGGWLSTSYDYYLWCELDGYYIPDYSAAVSYDGKLIDASDAEYIVSTVTLGTDVASANVSLVAGSSVSDLSGIIAGTATPLATVTESGTVNLSADGLTTGYYTLVVVTFDEDDDAQEYATATFLFKATGESEVDPLLLDYTWENIDYDLEPESPDGYDGSYSLYATDLNNDETSRNLQSSDVTIKYTGDDESGYHWLDISGFFPAYTEYYGFDDTFEVKFDDEIYVYNKPYLGEGSGYYWTILTTAEADGNNYYYSSDGACFTFFAPVYDGYLALMDLYAVYGYTYGFNGFTLFAYSDEEYSSVVGYVNWLTDVMLVKNTADTEAASIASARAAELRKALSSNARNAVETDKGFIKSVLEEYKAKWADEDEVITTASKSVRTGLVDRATFTTDPAL